MSEAEFQMLKNLSRMVPFVVFHAQLYFTVFYLTSDIILLEPKGLSNNKQLGYVGASYHWNWLNFLQCVAQRLYVIIMDAIFEKKRTVKTVSVVFSVV